MHNQFEIYNFELNVIGSIMSVQEPVARLRARKIVKDQMHTHFHLHENHPCGPSSNTRKVLGKVCVLVCSKRFQVFVRRPRGAVTIVDYSRSYYLPSTKAMVCMTSEVVPRSGFGGLQDIRRGNNRFKIRCYDVLNLSLGSVV